MNKRLVLMVWSAILLSTGFCWAAPQGLEKQSGDVLTTMEEVVVTATRREEKISAVPANVSVITEADIRQATAKNVPDLLKTQVGIQVSDITGNARTFSVDIRGFGETAPLNTLVLVDGRRINQADLSGTDWTLIPLNRIKRIEIIRGGRGSILYGDNAAGGVINIITREGEALHYGAAASAGSYDTYKGSAYVSGAQNDFSVALSGSYYNSDGYRDNSDTEAKDVGIKLNYYAGDRLRFDLSSGFHEDSTGLPGALKDSDLAAGASRTDSTQPNNFSDVEDEYVKGGVELFFLSESFFKLDASFRKRSVLSFASFGAGTFTGDTDIETVALSPQIVLRENLLGLDNRLTLGLDYLDVDEDITNDSVFFGVRSVGNFNLAKENFAVYIHDEVKPADNLALSGGYRHDRAQFSFTPSTPDQQTLSEDLYTAGVNYSFANASSVYVSYSRSFRYPVLDEMFRFFTNTIDTDISPQTSDDYEFGVRHYFSPRLYANLNVFHIETDDEIFFNPAAFANQNLDGKTRRQGIEVALAQTFSRIKLSGSYTFTDATVDGGQFDGKKFPNVPEHKANAEVLLTLKNGFSLAVSGVYVGRRPLISDFTNDFGDQEDYLVLNTKFGYNWKHYSAFVNINNLTDSAYSEFAGITTPPTIEKGFFPSPKINFLVGLSVDF